MTDRPILEQLAIVFGGVALAAVVYGFLIFSVILAGPA